MQADIHAFLLIVTFVALASIVLSARLKQERKQPRAWKEVLLSSIPVLAVGLISQLFMAIAAKPKLEWLIPFLGLLLIGRLTTNQRIFSTMRVAAPVIALLLVFHFIYASTSAGVTSAPAQLASIAKSRERASLQSARDRILQSASADEIYPAGEVEKVFPRTSGIPILEYPTAMRQWHTWFSQLSKVQTAKKTMWCRGGKLDTQSLSFLEYRIVDPPAVGVEIH